MVNKLRSNNDATTIANIGYDQLMRQKETRAAALISAMLGQVVIDLGTGEIQYIAPLLHATAVGSDRSRSGHG
jgi:hypothetical protein